MNAKQSKSAKSAVGAVEAPHVPLPARLAAALLGTAALLLFPAAGTAVAAPSAAGFALENLDVTYTEADGSPDTQAGSHPFAMTTSVEIPGAPTAEGGYVLDEAAKDILTSQIEGLGGEPAATPRCSSADFLTTANNPEGGSIVDCPDSSAVGTIAVTVANETAPPFPVYSPIYNLAPPPHQASSLGFWSGGIPAEISVGLSESPPYKILAGSRNVSQIIEVVRVKITLWGVPADSRHDPQRGKCLSEETGGSNARGSCPAEVPEVPLLTLPRACRGPLATTYEADSWEHPGSYLPGGDPDLEDPSWATGSVPTHEDAEPPNPQGMTGCEKLRFAPEITAKPTARAASSSTGLDFSLDVNDEGLTNPSGIADSDIEKAVVTLPKGLTINPSQAEGLAVCSEEQLARETALSAPGAGCPEASKIGTIEVETPLLPEKLLKGTLYVAKPYENEVGSLIALYIVIKDPELGIFVKQALKVEPDPQTGQLISTAEDMPQLPFSHFRLHFREGGRAPLISPPGCGTFNAEAKLYPYSGGSPVASTSAFQIVSGPNNSPCPPGAAPFHPGFSAGTVNNAAGRYSPFDMRITREDGEQDMGKFSFVLPPGVVPKLAGIPYCPEAGIAQAKSRTGPHGGTEELEHPSCPAASQIGRTLAGAGVGSQLTYVPGRLYLAGPYHGDPISAVAITPAVAGPFDAGVVVVREALRLNPVTYVGEVDGQASDPIPHILKGIPLNVRDLRVYADRPEFTLNATSCEPFAASSTIWGDGTALAPLGETPAGLSSRYQAADCASLGFEPKLGLKLRGGTRRGGFPALHAVYTPRAGDANLSRLALLFPHSEFIEQGHFRTICTRVQFAAGAGDGSACPPASVYGHVRAWTPLLDQPLEGPVYLRSSSHNLPDAVFALHGLVDIDVVVRIDSKGGGLRATVENSPDAPVSKAIVDMQGGQKGLFVNSTNLCAARHRAKADVTGQNGKRYRAKPPLRAAKCGHSKVRKGHRGRGGSR